MRDSLTPLLGENAVSVTIYGSNDSSRTLKNDSLMLNLPLDVWGVLAGLVESKDRKSLAEVNPNIKVAINEAFAIDTENPRLINPILTVDELEILEKLITLGWPERLLMLKARSYIFIESLVPIADISNRDSLLQIKLTDTEMTQLGNCIDKIKQEQEITLINKVDIQFCKLVIFIAILSSLSYAIYWYANYLFFTPTNRIPELGDVCCIPDQCFLGSCTTISCEEIQKNATTVMNWVNKMDIALLWAKEQCVFLIKECATQRVKNFQRLIFDDSGNGVSEICQFPIELYWGFGALCLVGGVIEITALFFLIVTSINLMNVFLDRFKCNTDQKNGYISGKELTGLSHLLSKIYNSNAEGMNSVNIERDEGDVNRQMEPT